MSVPRTLTATSAALVGLLALAGCASGSEAEPKETEPAAASVTIEDNTGTHEIATPPRSVVASTTAPSRRSPTGASSSPPAPSP